MARIAAEHPFELQLHLAGGRGRVLHLRLSRRQLALALAAALAYLLFLVLAFALAPPVFEGLFGSQEYRSLAAERSRQGERLHELVGRLDRLKERGERSVLVLRQVSLAYGLPPAAPPRPGAALAGPPLPGSIYAGAVDQGNLLRARIRAQLDDVEALMTEVRRFESSHPEQIRSTPSACPLRGSRFVLTNRFGAQRNAFTRELTFHGGIDLAAPAGSPISAPADGVVRFAGIYPLARSAAWWRFGNLVVLGHGERFITLFGHCDEIRVRSGQQVRQGEVVATVGSTGWSNGPHLHYEIRRRPGGAAEPEPVDPLLYILDHHWPNEERLLASPAGVPAVAGYFEPLPAGLLEGRLPAPRHRRHTRIIVGAR